MKLRPFDIRRAKRQRGFLLNPFRFGGGGGGPTGLIDSYTANLWGAYGLVLLRGNYSGSAIRVRRSSDNTEQDIGLSMGVLDTAALATFVGANDGFIVKWYDQSGGGNDFNQTTTNSKQPMIVDAGTYIGELIWDGSDDVLISVNNSGTPTAVCAVLAGRLRMGGDDFGAINGAQAESILYHRTGAENWYSIYTNTSGTADLYQGNVQNKAGGVGRYETNYAAPLATYGIAYDYTQGTLVAEVTAYRDGSSLGALTHSGSDAAGSFAADKWELGAIDGVGGGAKLAATALLIYERVLSGAEFTALNTILRPANYRTLQFDSYTTNLWALYSLRKQLTAYAGSAIRVRRSSDNTEQDIGFVSGYLDTASLLTFTGAGSGFITTWYDQSGNARNYTQATSGNQPRIVNSGVVDLMEITPGINFDGSNDFLATSATSGTPSAMTFYARARCTTGTGTRVLVEHSANYNSNDAAIVYLDVSQTVVGSHKNSPAGVSRSDFAMYPCGQVLTAVIDRAQVTSAAQTRLYSGGRLQTRAGNGDSGTLPTGNFGNHSFNLGCRAGGTLPFVGTMETFAIYTDAHSATTVERISRAIG